MTDNCLWPFGKEHPRDVPYILYLCECAYCQQQSAIIESNMQKKLLEQQERGEQ